jgi:hypothetical protein
MFGKKSYGIAIQVLERPVLSTLLPSDGPKNHVFRMKYPSTMFKMVITIPQGKHFTKLSPVTVKIFILLFYLF